MESACLQQSATGPYPEADKSHPITEIILFEDPF